MPAINNDVMQVSHLAIMHSESNIYDPIFTSQRSGQHNPMTVGQADSPPCPTAMVYGVV